MRALLDSPFRIFLRELWLEANMNKKDLWFLLIALGVVGLFTFLWAVSRKAPPLSVRPEHANVTRETRREDCWVCHAPDASAAPMSPRHPKKGKPPDTTTPCYVC